MIPLTVQVYEAGAGGVPSAATPLPPLPPIESYEHSISARGGFESLQVSFPCTAATALHWLSTGLMRSVVVYGPSGETCWEGFLETITATLGQETRSISMKELANDVIGHYADPRFNGLITSGVSNAASIARYGKKSVVLSFRGQSNWGITAYLAAHANPTMTPRTQVASGDGGRVGLTLTFAGWYQAFDYLTTTNSATTASFTTTQIQTLTTAYNGVNAYFSTDYSGITSSLLTDYDYIDPDTAYKKKIEALLAGGIDRTGLGDLVDAAWGIYEGRKWTIGPWAAVTPTVIDYVRSLGDGRIYTPGGAVVPFWSVRPDAMYQVADLLDPSVNATQQDAAARSYIRRVACRIDRGGMQLTLEPANIQSVETMMLLLARGSR